MAGILDGVRVIDFGRFIAAPYCAMLLADLGADCIRVERREGGEDRRIGPVTPSGEGGLFLNINRNKRGMTLALGHPQSREIVHRLVAGADVVVVNLPLSVMKKLQLDYESLRQIKPDIILVMVSAFGPDGPYADRIGFDSIAQAMSGAMSLTGFPNQPVRSIVPFVDYGTALHAAFGAVAALYRRQLTGQGELIDLSLLATSVTFMQPFLAERAAGIERSQWGNTSFWTSPSDAYRTRDGWIMVPTIGDWMFRRWADLVGRPELADDPRFRDDAARAENHETINQIMSQWCAGRSTKEALDQLQQARVPCGPVYRLDEVLDDPQVHARGLLEPVDYPGAERPVPLASAPVRFLGGAATAAPGANPRRAPQLGEHTGEVLSELGFSADEISALRRAEVV